MMEDPKTVRQERKLSRFLNAFPNKLESTRSVFLPYRRVFWSQRPECDSLSSSSDDSDVRVIHEKIKSAFSEVNVIRFKGLIQFWAPVNSTTGGRRLLSTSDQPFALEYLDTVFQKYRLCCMKHRYSIDDHVNENNTELVDEDDPLIISNGPVATAFLNQFPELVMDLRVHQGSPLVDKALECGLTCLILLPVFYHQASSSSCVGVVEGCLKFSGLISIFDALRGELKRVGLSTYHVQECLPYKTMPSLKHARDEIVEALKIVCDSYQLSLAQVWISKEIEKHKFVVKLCGYHVDGVKVGDDFMAYSDNCDVLPLKKGEGLPGRMLEETNNPLCFCKDVCKLRREGWLGFLCGCTNGCCFVICLRSIHTGDINYAFELLWPKSRDYVTLLRCLIPTLRKCLPSFKCASDAIEEKLQRLANRQAKSQTLQMPNPLEEEWQGPKFVKRRLSGCEPAGYSENYDTEFWGYDNDILVTAQDYTGKQVYFMLRCSYVLENVKEEVEDRFNLEPETYIIEFRSAEGVKVQLNTDDDLAHCIKLWRTGRYGRLVSNSFRVRVLQKE